MSTQTETPICSICHGTGEVWDSGPRTRFDLPDGTFLITVPQKYIGPCPDCVEPLDWDEAIALFRKHGMHEFADALERWMP